MASSLLSSLIRFRDFSNSFLSQFEPLTLLLAPLLTLFVGRVLQSFLHVVHGKGFKATLLGFFMSSVKLIPGVKKYIDAEKPKVVNKLQSSGKSKRDGWRNEFAEGRIRNWSCGENER